jgi:predicted GNAT family acetyltransferase
MGEISIEHKSDEQRFVVAMEGHEAELSYEPIDESTLDYTHTYVPNEFRGRGVGARLVKRALDYARENGYKVRPTCPFVTSFVERKPEYRELLVS